MRAIWSSVCDQSLLNVLFDERRNGRQTDNAGWHSSAWSTAESKLSGSEARSGGAAKTAASCQTRYNTLKKDYKEVKAIRELSGFGWDDDNHLATAADDVWESYIQAHPKQKKWRKTSFPLYKEMADLVEGTYATGKGVVRPGDHSEDTDISDAETNNSHSDPNVSQISVISESRSAKSTTPATPARVVDTPSTSNKRSRGHRKSGSQAIDGMTSSIARLAEAFAADAVVPSPSRKRAAIHMIEDDGQLTSPEQLKAYKLIRTDTSFADMIVSIRNQSARTAFIKDEINMPLND
ncbi:hypothetical protein H0H93_006081 [Arthromyces matolae]|nr:hypothetical protein H0H93_006081 [Arthromyces matolae]